MPDVDEIERQKVSPEGQRLKAHLADRHWRLGNLYSIKAEDGSRIRFKPNEAQIAYEKATWCRDLIPKARKLGFSTYICIDFLDECLFRGGSTAGIVDRSLDDAVDKLSIMKYAYDNMPGELGAQIRAARPLLKSNESELKWNNDSTVTVGTSYRGGTPTMLHVSEFGKISTDSPDQAKEIMTGAIQAVPISGRVRVESTSHGTTGKFYDMVKSAQNAQKAGQPLTRLDFKLHFYGWWIKREYRVPNNLVVLTHEQREYFEILKAKHGLKIDADQMAWYAKKIDELGPDDMKQEFPSVVEELFFNSILGAYWKSEINKARREGRVGQAVPYDPSYTVDTWWDIGEDCTVIGFSQHDGLRTRVIDYWEEEGSSLQAAIGILDEKRVDRGFVYGTHYGPHDLNNRDWAKQAQSRYQTAIDLGVKFDVVDRVQVKADSIEAARRLWATTWVDQEHAALFVERAENYRKRWNKLLMVFSSDPVHGIESHGSDAWQGLAMGQKPDKSKGDDADRRSRQRPKRSSWGA